MSKAGVLVISDDAIRGIRKSLVNISNQFNDLNEKLKKCEVLENLSFDNGSIAMIKEDIANNKKDLASLDRYLSSLLAKTKSTDENIAISLKNLRSVAKNKVPTMNS